MTYSNPTEVRLGKVGTLEGTRFTVVGRTVLSTESEGETYYWNEFNLQDDTGRYATLVYEEVEDGSPWKLFKLIDPRSPLERSQAAAMRVNDAVTIEGRNARVSLVGRSRVVVTEGTVGDGVEVGDVADYFNADYADKMLVVSWSGDDVEHYEGRTVSGQQIERAFGMMKSSPVASLISAPTAFWSDRFTRITAVVVVVSLLVLGWIGYSYFSARRSSPPNKVQTAPENTLALGQPVLVGGHTYSIGAHAVVEVGRLGQRFQRHEYALSESFEDAAWLVNGLDGNLQRWHVLKRMAIPSGLTPMEAAKLRQARQASLGGRTVGVAQVFLARVVSVEGTKDADLWPDPVQYGFLARAADDWIVARWSEQKLQLYEGRVVDAGQISAALAATANK